MLLSKVRAVFGLYGQAEGIRPGTEWSPKVGALTKSLKFPDADILYSVDFGSITASNNPSIALWTGVAAANGGTVSRTSARDFEWTALPGQLRIFGLMFERLDAVEEVVMVRDFSDSSDIYTLNPGETLFMCSTGGVLGADIGGKQIYFAMLADGTPASVRMTLLGASTAS